MIPRSQYDLFFKFKNRWEIFQNFETQHNLIILLDCLFNDSAVSVTPLSLTLRCQWRRRAWLRSIRCQWRHGVLAHAANNSAKSWPYCMQKLIRGLDEFESWKTGVKISWHCPIKSTVSQSSPLRKRQRLKWTWAFSPHHKVSQNSSSKNFHSFKIANWTSIRNQPTLLRIL